MFICQFVNIGLRYEIFFKKFWQLKKGTLILKKRMRHLNYTTVLRFEKKFVKSQSVCCIVFGDKKGDL